MLLANFCFFVNLWRHTRPGIGTTLFLAYPCKCEFNCANVCFLFFENVRFQNDLSLGVKRPFVSIATGNTWNTNFSSTLARHGVSPLCSPQRLSCLCSSFCAVLQQVRLNVTKCCKTLPINPSGGVCCCAELNAAHLLDEILPGDCLLSRNSGNSLEKLFSSDFIFDSVCAVRGCSLCRCCRLLLWWQSTSFVSCCFDWSQTGFQFSERFDGSSFKFKGIEAGLELTLELCGNSHREFESDSVTAEEDPDAVTHLGRGSSESPAMISRRSCLQAPTVKSCDFRSDRWTFIKAALSEDCSLRLRLRFIRTLQSLGLLDPPPSRFKGDPRGWRWKLPWRQD